MHPMIAAALASGAPLVGVLAVLAVLLLSARAAGDVSPLSLLENERRIAVERFGVPYDPSVRYRVKSWYDTQDLATADATETKFFDSKKRTDHTNLAAGTNFTEAGKAPENAIIFGLGVELLAQDAGTNALLVDLVKARDYTMLSELRINNVPVLEDIHLAKMGLDWGVRPVISELPSDAIATTALKFEGAVMGPPGGSGLMLDVFGRQFVQRDSDIVAVCRRDSGGALSAVVRARIHLFVLEMKGGNLR